MWGWVLVLKHSNRGTLTQKQPGSRLSEGFLLESVCKTNGSCCQKVTDCRYLTKGLSIEFNNLHGDLVLKITKILHSQTWKATKVTQTGLLVHVHVQFICQQLVSFRQKGWFCFYFLKTHKINRIRTTRWQRFNDTLLVQTTRFKAQTLETFCKSLTLPKTPISMLQLEAVLEVGAFF